MSEKMISFKSPMHPAITSINGTTFVVGGGVPWLQVPAGTTLEQVRWIGPKVKKVVRPVEHVREVLSSKGTKTYTVKVRTDGMKSCTCPGFTYRRFCKHVEALKKEVGV